METAALAACGVHCRSLNGILPLLGCRWNPLFMTAGGVLHSYQCPNDTGAPTAFIEFMLSAIKASLIDAISTSDEMSDEPMDKATMRWKQIEKFRETHPYIMNADVRTLCGVSATTANRILANLLTKEKLGKYFESGHWIYRVKWIP